MTHIALKNLQYPIFEANQVLSSNHLNELLQYLDESDLATRCHTVGTGWLGGAEVTVSLSNHKLSNIHVSCGAGITSLGYLAAIDECDLRYAVEYTDPLEEAPEGGDGNVVSGYLPFKAANGSQATIWELKTTAEVATLSDADKQTARQNFRNIPKSNHVLLAYVEADQQDIKSCYSEDCTDRGQRMHVNVRKLAMRYETKLATHDDGSVPLTFNSSPVAEGLDVLRMPRIMNYESGDLPALYGPIFDEVISDFSTSLASVREKLGAYFEKNALTWSKQAIESKLQEKRTRVPANKIQVYYDFLRDLVTAYNHLVYDGIDLHSQACPDARAFPRHLLMSELQVNDTSARFLEQRHYFKAPSGLLNEEKTIRRVRNTYLKLLQMMNRFRSDILPTNFVKIRPQTEFESSENVIPYYYDVSGASGQPLKKLWNVTAKDLGATAPDASYYRDTRDNPFTSNIDDQKMVRVEGVLGMDADKSVDQIEALQQRFGLSFNVVRVYKDDGFDHAANPLLDVAGQEYDYYQRRLEFSFTLKSVHVFLAKTIEGYQTSLAYLALSPPAAKGLIAALDALTDILPAQLQDFDQGKFLQLYMVVLDKCAKYRGELLAYIHKVLKARVRSTSIQQPGIKNGTPYHVLVSLAFNELMNQLDSLFSVLNPNFLLQAAEKYQADIARYRLLDGRKFSNFYQEHRGIEHIAGVPFNGTLVLLIAGGKVVGDFYLPYLCCCPCPPTATYPYVSEVHPFYHEAVWQEEVLLGKVSAFAGNTASLFGLRQEKPGHKEMRDQEFFETAEKLSDKELPVLIDHGSSVYLTERNGEEYLALGPGTDASGHVVSFVVGTKTDRAVRCPYWVALISPFIVAHDDVAVTIVKKPVKIRVLDNDLTSAPDVSVGVTKPPQYGDVSTDKDEPTVFIYTPDEDRLAALWESAAADKQNLQATDEFEYKLLVTLPEGQKLISHARVVVHIVDCCEEEVVVVPPIVEGTIDLPELIFCNDEENSFYHFRIGGNGRNLKGPSTGPGFGYLDARTGKIDGRFTGKNLSDTDVKEFGLERVFMPGLLKPGMHSYQYKGANATGQDITKSFTVTVYSFSDKFTATAVQGNFKKYKFSYRYAPTNASVEYQWYFSDNIMAPVTSAAPTHTFSTSGQHEVTLVVKPKGSDSCIHKIKQKVLVLDATVIDRRGDIIIDVPDDWPPVVPPDWPPVRDDTTDWSETIEGTYRDFETWHSYKKLLGTSIKGDEGYRNYLDNRFDGEVNKQTNKILNSVNKIAEADINTADGERFDGLGELIESPASTVAEFFGGKPLTNEGRASFKKTIETMKAGKKSGVVYSEKFRKNLATIFKRTDDPSIRKYLSSMRRIADT